MTDEEIARALTLDTAWHDSDVVIVLAMGILLGLVAGAVIGYKARRRDERKIAAAVMAARTADATGTPAAPAA